MLISKIPLKANKILFNKQGPTHIFDLVKLARTTNSKLHTIKTIPNNKKEWKLI
mgnify:CR=1 FL=1